MLMSIILSNLLNNSGEKTGIEKGDSFNRSVFSLESLEM